MKNRVLMLFCIHPYFGCFLLIVPRGDVQQSVKEAPSKVEFTHRTAYFSGAVINLGSTAMCLPNFEGREGSQKLVPFD